MPIINNFGGINKEIQKIDDLLNNIEREYEGTLPKQIDNCDGDSITDYKIYGNSGGVGEATGNLLNIANRYLNTTLVQADNVWRYSESVASVLRTPCKANTTYTFKYFSDFPTITTIRVFETASDDIPALNEDIAISSLYVLNNQQPSNKTFTVTTSATAKYLLLQVTATIMTDFLNVAMIVEGSTTPESYKPYGYGIDIKSETTWSSNLFDKNNSNNYVNAYIDSADGYYRASAGNSWSILIPCTANTRYKISGFQSQTVTYRFAQYSQIPSVNDMPIKWLKMSQAHLNEAEFTTDESVGGYLMFFGYNSSNEANIYTKEQYFADILLQKSPPINITPLYIGSSTLGKGDYIDSATGKVYHLKAVHEDTVDINEETWNILGYDCDTVYKSDGTLAQHTVTIQTNGCIARMPFNEPEALYYCENGLAAGTYYFTIDSTYMPGLNDYSAYQFTLTKNVPAGGILMFPWGTYMYASAVKVSSYANNLATTAIESVSTVDGTDGINLGEFTIAGDAVNNRNSISRARFGSNNWLESDVRQYLNSTAEEGSVWTPQNKFDRPPDWITYQYGFLIDSDPNFISVLGNTVKTTILNTPSDGGGKITTSEKIFLLSCSEVYADNEVIDSEGAPYPYYQDYSNLNEAGRGADSNRIKRLNMQGCDWWLRSPSKYDPEYVNQITSSGAITTSTAIHNYCLIPACTIILDGIETNPWLQRKFLKQVDPPVSPPSIPTFKGQTTLSYASSGTSPEKVWFKYHEDFNIEEVYFGDKHIFSVWGEYVGILPAQFSANGDDLKAYKVWGNTGGVGKETVNLFDQDNLPLTGYLNGDGTVTSNSSWGISDYIPVKSEQIYRIQNSRGNSPGYCFYDNNKEYISGEGFQNRNGFNVTTPSTAKYIRVSVSTTSSSSSYNKEIFMLTEGSTAPESYVPYGYEVDVETVDGTKNLYNTTETTWSANNTILNDNGDPISSNSHYTTNFTTVNSNTPYYLSGTLPSETIYRIYFYNASKEWISRSPQLVNRTFVTPTGCFYIQLQVGNDFTDTSTWVLIEGSTAPESYIPYTSTTTPIYIGGTALQKDEYVDSVSGKVYRRTENLLPPHFIRGTYTPTGFSPEYENIAASSSIVHLMPGTYSMIFSRQYAEYIITVSDGKRTSVVHSETAKTITFNVVDEADYVVQINVTPMTDNIVKDLENTTMLTTGATAPAEYIPYLQPTDPPVPLPAIPTVDGSTIIEVDSVVQPEKVELTYRKEDF